jgi:hypothetical protein
VEFQNRIVERGLRNQPEYTSTPSRVLEETGLNTYLSGIYSTDNYRQELNLDYSVRNEINKLKTNYTIDSTELNSLSQFENQKDNNSVRANFKSKSIFNLFNSDSLKVSYSATIFRYDTPSQLNMDDRDEFFSLLNLEYNHKFSSNLFAGLVFENLQNHLVFLKSSRSSSNNWNKIYRLSPYLTIKTQDFSMQSQFEVLANYTIYDFEAINPSIKSYSYRQIGYKDSLFLNLGNSTNIQLKVTARLYERGVLYWKEFAESPQNRNLEIFSKMIFFSKPLYNLQAGIGVRYFYLSQTKIGNNIPGAINNNFINKIWGPEAIIITNFSNGSSLSFQGWLEFRNYNSLNTITPNFFINCNLLL